MIAASRRWAVLVLAPWLGACVIDASIDGKGCPCADGYICNAADMCVRKTCDPGVVASSFAPAWATSHSIGWTWKPGASEDLFVRYEVWVAETKEDLAARTGTARRFGKEENPELGGYRLRVATDLVSSTITRGLEGGTTYFAQLIAVDVRDCEFASERVQRSTPPEPQSSIDLFKDGLPAGAETGPAPPAYQVADDPAGGMHLVFDVYADDECVPDEMDFNDVKATCGQPLRVRGFSADVSHDPSNPAKEALEPGTFVDAYLAMEVDIDAVVPSYFSWLWLANGASCLPAENPDHIFRYDGAFTIPNGKPTTIELPLSVLENVEPGSARPFSYDEIDAQGSGSALCSFALGGSWHKLGVVHVDDVAIWF